MNTSKIKANVKKAADLFRQRKFKQLILEKSSDKVPVRGEFTIEVFKNGEKVDEFKEHNLITDEARSFFAKIVIGATDGVVINNLRLGTSGHVGDDYFTPRTAIDGFTSARTDLFCGTKTTENRFLKWDKLEFIPSGSVNITEARVTDDGSANNSVVDIAYAVSETGSPSITYTFSIAQEAFNLRGDAKYTEAGLFANNEMIAMRTFKLKAKDSETSFRITWVLVF